MLEHSIFGGWITLWLLSFFYCKSVVELVFCLFWTFIPFLLSLPLDIKFAPTLGVLYTRVCRHLGFVPGGRDEVRGRSSFVCDEDSSETKFFRFLSVFWFEASFSWRPASDLNLKVLMAKAKLELLLEAFTDALKAQNGKIGQSVMSYISENTCTINSVYHCVYSRLHGATICITGLIIILVVFLNLFSLGEPERAFQSTL